MFWLCVPLAAQVLVPTLLNFLAEEQLPAQLRGVTDFISSLVSLLS
jgi:hypothetical protein